MVYISSSNLTTSLRQSVLQTQSSLANVNKEISSGVYADLGLQLGGETSRAISLSQQSGTLTALTSSNATATTRLTATTTALDSIMAAAQSLSNNIVGDTSAGTITAAVQTQAQTSLQSLIGDLNTSVAGQFIFAGTNTSNSPMVDYATNASTTSTALNNDLAGLNSDPSQITGAQMQAYLADPTTSFGSLFHSTGWSALSTASTTTITNQISASQSASTSVSATEAGFQNIAQAYSLLNGIAGKGLSSDAGQAVIAAATSLLNQGIASITKVEANVGVVQNSITDANTQMAAQQTILTDNVNNMEDVDTYTLNTKLSALTTQLQDSYSLTSQLKSLSLVNYLTGG